MAKKQNKQVKQNTRSHSWKNNKLVVITAAIVIIALISYFIYSVILKPSEPGNEEYMFKKEGELSIADSSGNPKIKIDIEIADNDYDRQLGLMLRKRMEENQGMLFIFPQDDILSFWMRNTFIPLDIIFLDSAKQIVSISKNAVPLSDTPHSSARPARYVLEVNAGFTDKYNIIEGDKITFNQN